MAKDKYFKFFIFTLLIALIIPQITFAAWWNPMSWGIWNRVFHFKQTQQKQEKVACTMEAKLCPDGSSVGREGPKCEFKACPKDKNNPIRCLNGSDCQQGYYCSTPSVNVGVKAEGYCLPNNTPSPY